MKKNEMNAKFIIFFIINKTRQENTSVIIYNAQEWSGAKSNNLSEL